MNIKLLITLIFVSRWDGSIANCAANQDCVVDCGYRDCSHHTITTTNALSLKVICSYSSASNNGYCDYMTIYCPNSPTALCRIDCNGYQCNGLNIYYSQPQHLFINCYGLEACSFLQLIGPKTYVSPTSRAHGNATIICTHKSSSSHYNYGACHNAKFDVSYIRNVDISCVSSTSYAGSISSCYQMIVYGKYVNELSLECNQKGCQSANIFVDEAYNVNMYCTTSYLYGEPCDDVNIYIKGDKTDSFNLNCHYGLPCDITIHISDNYVLNWMEIDFLSNHDSSGLEIVCETRGSETIAYDYYTQSYVCRNEPYICCPWNYGGNSPNYGVIICDEIINDEQENCIIDCGHLKGGCKGRLIDAYNSSSLKVICNTYESVCAETKIFGPRSYVGNNLKVTIECLSTNACVNLKIVGYSNNYFNISCNGINACSSMELYLDETHETQLICDGYHSCYKAKISVNNVTNFYGLFVGNSAIENGTIYGNFISNELSITCGSAFSVRQYPACESLNIYGKIVGDRISNLNCESFGCGQLIFTLMKDTISKWYVFMNGCEECNSLDECRGIWRYECSHYSYYSYYAPHCFYNHSLTVNNWVQNAEICILEKPNIICEQNKDCIINCDDSTNCAGSKIGGSKCSSLTVNCNNKHSCISSIVYCPFNDNTLCIINCKSEYVCNQMEIYVQSGHIDLTCYGSYSCLDIIIKAINAGIINIKAYGNHAISNGYIIAPNASELHVSCYGYADIDNIDTCYNTTIYAPAISQTWYPYKKQSFLNCYGTGCHSLNLVSYNGFDDWELNINGCNVCNNISNCINYWNSTCSDGTSCVYRGFANDCQCISEITLLTDTFINNESLCDYLINIIDLQTITSTTMKIIDTETVIYESSNNRMDEFSNNRSDASDLLKDILVTLCVLIVLIVLAFVSCVVFFIYYKKNMKINMSDIPLQEMVNISSENIGKGKRYSEISDTLAIHE